MGAHTRQGWATDVEATSAPVIRAGGGGGVAGAGPHREDGSTNLKKCPLVSRPLSAVQAEGGPLAGELADPEHGGGDNNTGHLGGEDPVPLRSHGKRPADDAKNQKQRAAATSLTLTTLGEMAWTI
jgi:hypothetical protein